MVANVSGNGIGLLNSSAGTLGAEGLIGAAAHGAAGEGVHLNVATGNLSIQDKDDYVAATGISIALTRTYNSQSSLNDGNGASWKLGLAKKVTGLTGTVNTAGSTVTRIDGDGSVALYRYDAQRGAYVSTDGGGAYQTITFNQTANEWVWRADRNDVQGLHETYDAANGGRIIRSSDETGVRLTYHYNASNQLAQVHDASGDDVYFDFNNGNLSGIRTVAAGGGPVLSRVSYAYDNLNRLVSVTTDLTPADKTDARSYATIYTYAGTSSRIETAEQSDGSKLTFGYQEVSGVWKVSSITDGMARTTMYDYAEPGRTVMTDPLGYRSVYTYDGQGQLLSVSTPALSGATELTRFAYDEAGNVARTIDARGLATEFGYDGNGNRILERDAAGNTIKRVYSQTSNKLLQETRFLDTDPDGAGAAQPLQALVTNYVYDGANRLRFVVSAENRVDEFRYSAQGQRSTSIEYIDARFTGATAGSVLDLSTLVAWSQLTSTVQSRASRVDYAYDARGLLQQSTVYAATVGAVLAPPADASAATERYVYDHAGQLLQSIDGNGNVTSFSYDGLGRVLTTTDALRHTTRNNFDAAGNRVSSTFEDGVTTTSIYDKTGALSAMVRTDRQGNELGRTGYAYDGSGRLRTVTDPAGARSFILYDEAGRNAADITATGSLTEYRYDANGQLIQTIAYAQSVNAAALASLAATGAAAQPPTFEQSGLRPAPHGADAREWRFYDNANRLVKVVDALGGVRDYVYDGASRLIQEVRRAVAMNVAVFAANPLAANAVPPSGKMDRITRMAYDKDGLLRLTLDGEGYLTEQKYDGAGLSTQTIRYATAVSAQTQASANWDQIAIVSSASDIVSSTTYDGRGKARTQTDGAGNVTTYSYDGAGNPLTVSRAGVLTRNVYDKLGRVVETHADASGSDQVTRNVYDKYGNVVARRDALGQTTRFIYDAENRLVFTVDPLGGVSETVYDKRGFATQTIRHATPVDPALFAGLTDGSTAVISGTVATFMFDGTVPITTGKSYTVRGRVRQLTGVGFIYAGVYTTDAAGKVIHNPYGSTFAYAGEQGTTLTPERGWVEFQGTIGGEYAPAYGVYDPHKFFAGSANAAPLLLYNYYGTKAADGQMKIEVDYVELVDNATGQVLNANAAMTAGTGGWLGPEAYGALAPGVTTSPLVTVEGVRALLRPDAAKDVRQIQRHDQDGRLIWSVDGTGAVTRLIYDANGNVVKRLAYTEVLGAAALAQLAANPAALPVPAPAANITSYIYDANQRLLFTVDPLGNVSESRYDALGDVVQVVTYATPVKADVVHTGISQGNPAMAESALRTLLGPSAANDVRQVQTYDRNGRVRFTVDGAGAVSERIYDASGNMVRTVDYANTLPPHFDFSNWTMPTVNRLVNPTFLDGSEDGKADTWGLRISGGTATIGVNYPAASGGLPAAPDESTIWLQQDGRAADGSFQELTQEIRTLSAGTRYAFSVYTAAIRADVSAHIVWYDANWHRLGATPEDAASRNVRTHTGGSLSEFKRIVAEGVAPTGAVFAQLLLRKSNTIEGQSNSVLVAARAQFEALPAGATGARAWSPLLASESDRTVNYVYDRANRLRFTVDANGAVSERVYDAAGNLVRTTDYAMPLSASGMATVASLNQLTVNGLDNPTFTDNNGDGAADGWTMGQSGGTASTGLNYSAPWRVVGLPSGDNTAWVHQLGSDAVANGFKELSQPIASVTAGTRYAFSAYTGAHRSTVSAHIVWSDAAGNVIGSTEQNAASSNAGTHSGGATLASYKRVVAQGIAPAGAVRATVVLRLLNRATGSDSAWLFAAHAQFEALPDNVTTPSAWGLLRAGEGDRSTRNVYDQANRLRYSVDPMGAVREHVYDGVGNVVRTIDYASVLAPDQVPGPSSIKTGPNDRTTRYIYDKANRVRFTVDAAGAVSERVYNAIGNVERVIEYATPMPASNFASLVSAGRHQSSAADRATHYIYDKGSRLRFSVDASGAVSERAYDAAGRLVRATEFATVLPPQGFAALAKSDSSLSPVAGATADRTTRYVYDKAGQLRYTVDAMGAVSEQRYDAAGNVVERIAYFRPLKDQGVLSEDAVLLGLQDPARDQHSYSLYNARGEQVYSIDAAGSVLAQSFDAFGNVLTVTKYGATIDRILSAGGVASVTALTSAGEAGWSKLRDLLAAQKTESELISRNVYDLNGRLTHRIDGEGSVTEYQYDVFGKVSKTIAYARPLQGVQVRYTPNANAAIWMSGGDFKAGDTVTATVWYKSPPDTLGMIYVGDPGGATRYSNSVWVSEYGNDGWRKLTATRLLTEDETIIPHVYGDVLGTAADRSGHSVLYSNFQLSSVQRGLVLDKHFEKGTEGWEINGDSSTAGAASVADLAAINPTSGPGLQRMLAAQRSSADAVTANIYDAAGRLAHQVAATGAVTDYVYDAFGNVTKTVQRAKPLEGGDLQLAHSQSRLPATVAGQVTPADRISVHTYDVLGRSVHSVNAVGAITEKQYDVFGNTIKTIQYARAMQNADLIVADGASAPSQLRLRDMRSADDRVTSQTYDATGRPVRRVDVSGAATEVLYDTFGGVVKTIEYAKPLLPAQDWYVPGTDHSSPDDRVSLFQYDAAGRRILHVDPAGALTRTEYDPFGRASKTESYAEPLQGVQVWYAPNSNSSISKSPGYFTKGDTVTASVWYKSDSDTHARIFLGDANEVTSPGYGNDTAMAEYGDGGWRKLTVSIVLDADEQMDVYLYGDRDGSAANKTGHSVMYSNLQVSSVKRGLVMEENFADGSAGWFTSGRSNGASLADLMPAAAANWATMGAMLNDRPTVDDRIRTDLFSYDGAGRLLSATDASGATERYEYNALGQKVRFINKLGAVWDYEYDDAGRLVLEIAPPVDATEGSYDFVARKFVVDVGAKIRPRTLLRYDVFGNLEARTEAQGTSGERTTVYKYDHAGRQVKTELPKAGVYNEQAADLAGNGVAGNARRVEDEDQIAAVSVTYDALGNAVTNIDVGGKASHKVYDPMGRVCFEIDAKGYVTEYQRDQFGNATRMIRYAERVAVRSQSWSQQDIVTALKAIAHNEDRAIDTVYDRMNRAVRVTDPQAYVFDQNDLDGTEATSYAGHAARTTQTAYNTFGEVLTVDVYGVDSSGKQVTEADSTRLFHDLDGRKSAVFTVVGKRGAVEEGYLTRMRYDAAGNLESQVEYATRMTLDEVKQALTRRLWPEAVNDRMMTFKYDRNNRKIEETVSQVTTGATRVSTLSYGYDVLGNQTRSTDAVGVSTFTYFDKMGRIVAVATPTAMMRTQVTQLYVGILNRAPDHDGLRYFVRAMENGASLAAIAKELIDSAEGKAIAGLHAPSDADFVNQLYRVAFGREADANASFWLAKMPTASRSEVAALLLTSGNAADGADAAGLTLEKEFNAKVSAALRFAVGDGDNVVLGAGAASNNGDNARKVLTDVAKAFDDNPDYVDPHPFGNASAGLSEFRLDVYGNVVQRTDYAHGAHSASALAFTVRAAPADKNRISYTDYDRNGRALLSVDANGNVSQASYDVYGRVAKQWQTVKDADGVNRTAFTRTEYDALGNVIAVTTPGANNLGWAVDTHGSSFNAFGELTGKNLNGAADYEYYDYDASGQLWRTNAGDGVDKVVLHDAKGRETAQIVSRNTELKAPGYADAASVAALAAGLERTETAYDLMGRVVTRTGAARDEGSAVASSLLNGGLEVQVIEQPLSSANYSTPRYSLKLAWKSLAGLGRGDFKVEASVTAQPDVKVSRLYTDSQLGENNLPTIEMGAQGPYTVKVFKKDVTGQWVLLLASARPEVATTLLKIAAPPTPSIAVSLRFIDIHSGAPATGPDGKALDTTKLANFGDAYLFDTDKLADGKYAFEVLYQRTGDATPYVHESGTLTVNSSLIRHQIGKLYVMLLNRAPDSGGLNFWINQIKQGTSPDEVVAQIMRGDEAAKLYSGFTDRQIVEKFVSNIGATGSAEVLAQVNGYVALLAGAGADPLARGRAFAKIVLGMQAAIPLASLAHKTYIEKVAVGLRYGYEMGGTSAAVARRIIEMITPTTDAAAFSAAVTAANLEASSDVSGQLRRTQVTQLYITLLNRAPDSAGLQHFVTSLSLGYSPEQVAADILTSDEAVKSARLSPLLTSAQFVSRLYRDVLGREPDAAQLAAAVAKLDAATPMTRARFAVEFGDALAAYNGTDRTLQGDQRLFRNKVAIGLSYANLKEGELDGVAAALIAAVNSTAGLSEAARAAQLVLEGVVTASEAAREAVIAASRSTVIEQRRAQVAGLYVTILNRTPDKNGIASWVADFERGATLETIANYMLASDEAAAIYPPGMAPAALVHQVYALSWGRAPTPAEEQKWVAAMPAKTRGQVICEIMNEVVSYHGDDAVALTLQDSFNTKVALGIMFAVQMGGGDDGTRAAFRIIERVKANDVSGAIQVARAAVVTSATNAKQVLTTATETASDIATRLALATDAVVKATSAAAKAALEAAAGLPAPAQLRVQIVQLYRAVLNRTLTNPEVAYWFDWMQAGHTVVQLAQELLRSDEATGSYSLYPTSLDATSFIGRVYDIVLGRQVDATGLNFWLGHSSTLSRAALLVNILASFVNTTQSDPGEYALQMAFQQKIAAVLGTLASDAEQTAFNDALAAQAANANYYTFLRDKLAKLDTFWIASQASSAADAVLREAAAKQAVASQLLAVQNAPLTFMTQLYEAMLGRAPDVQGLLHFVGAVANAGSLTDLSVASVADDMLKSDEAQARFFVGANSTFVQQIYLNVRGRSADSTEVDAWLNTSSNPGQLFVNITQAFLGSSNLWGSELNAQSGFNQRVANAINAMRTNASADLDAYNNAAFAATAKANAATSAFDIFEAARKTADYAGEAWAVADRKVAASNSIATQTSAAYRVIQAVLTAGSPIAALQEYANAASASNQERAGKQSITRIAEVYQALLRRAPDLVGTRYWLGIAKAGGTDIGMVNAVLADSEAKAYYPDGQTNAQFVETLYQNVLGRAGDAAGAAYWADVLNTRRATKAEVVLGFMQSVLAQPTTDTLAFNNKVAASLDILAAAAAAAPLDVDEFIRATATQAALEAANGSPPATIAGTQATTVTRLYVSLIDQAPDFAGLTFWLGTMINSAQTPVQVADAILSSAQAAARFPASLSREAFVRQFYLDSFGRSPAADEVVYWTAQLASKSRGQVAMEMIEKFANYSGADAGMLMSKNFFGVKVAAALRQVAAGAPAALNIASVAASIAKTIAGSHPTDPYQKGGLEIGKAAALTSSQPVVRHQVDRWGNVVSVSDARNADWRIEYTYNAHNAVTSTRSTATGATTRTEYDAAGRAVKTIDGNGNVSGTVYDTRGDVVAEVRFDGVVRYDRDIFGSTRAVVQANGVRTGYKVDKLGNVVEKATDVVDYATAEYRALDGHVYADPTGRAVLVDSYQYDEQGRRIKETNGAGNSSKTFYDLKGNVVATIDGLQNVTYAATYNAFGHKLTQFVNGRREAMTWDVDAFGKVQRHVDLDKRATGYVYDHAGRLTYQYFGAAADTAKRISHEYDSAGQLVRITDSQNADAVKVTQYHYDSAGNRVSEQTHVQNAAGKTIVVVQANQISYDALNRVSRISDTRYDIQYSYDANGNRVNVKTRYVDGKGVERVTDNWNAFDQANRQTVVDGVYLDADGVKVSDAQYVNGKVRRAGGEVIGGKIGIDTKQGHEIGYDGSGNRISDKYYGKRIEWVTTSEVGQDSSNSVVNVFDGFTEETYHYDMANRLALVRRRYDSVERNSAGFTTNTHTQWYDINLVNYDKAGRVVSSGISRMVDDWKTHLSSAGVDTDKRLNIYDQNGRMLYQTVMDSAAGATKPYRSDTSWQYNIDGTNRSVFTKSYSGDKVHNVAYEYNYEYFDSAKVSTVAGWNWYNNDRSSDIRLTHSHYDLTGSVVKVEEGKGVADSPPGGTVMSYKITTPEPSKTRYFVNDAQGQVLLKSSRENNSDYVGNIDNATHTLIANGVYIGDSSIASDDRAVDSFSNNHTPINVASMSASAGTYTVQVNGETFSSIAKSVWGDASLWYVLADANGSINSGGLTQGQTLVLPSRVNAVRNSYDTFKPYSAERAIGDLSPSLPPPPAAPAKKGCGTLGMIIMVVVAVVVTIYTAGAATQFMAGFAGGAGSAGGIAAGASAIAAGTSTAMGAGMAALGTASMSGVIASVIGGAVGSIASQVAGMAMGMQDSINWKGVALSAIGSGVTAGLGGGVFNGANAADTFTKAMYAAGNAAVGNAMTQGVSMVVGLQDKFNWRSVAASAASAGVGRAVGVGLGDTAFGKAIDKLGVRTLSGFAGGVVGKIVAGGKINYAHIAADAFGNALAEGIVDAYRSSLREKYLAEDQMRAGRADAAAYADAWRGDAGSEPISRVAAERMQYGGMSQREVFQGNKDWLRALGPYTGSFGSDSTLPLNLGGVNSPEMLFATDRSILQNRGASDFQWSKVVNGQQIVTRETRLGVDDYLDYAQSYVSQRFNEMDDIASAAGSSTSSRVFAAGTYGLRRIAEHTINGLIGIPRFATSPTLLPSLIRAVANPARTATALTTQFRGMATQDKIVFGLEAALPFKGRIEGLAGRVPGAGKYLQGTLGYSQNYGVTLSADGKLYGSISEVPEGYFRGPLGGQRGAVAVGRFGEIKNGSVSNADVLDPVTQARLDRYVAAVNSNAPWKWREIDAKITQRERAAIREYAYAQELVPRIPVDPITRYADFSSVVLREESVPKSLWNATDRQQFLYLDDLIGGRPTGTTWHHHQDPGRTQLVPLGVHNITSHSGGRTTWSLGPR